MSQIDKNQKNSGTVLFHFSQKNGVSKKTNKKVLKDFQVIKPGIGEKILCVQRRHPISLYSSFGQLAFVILSILLILFAVSNFLQDSLLTSTNEWVVMIYIAFTAAAIFFVSLIFIFMNWYYEFYIITNRSILHRYSFRLAGPFSEIVYGERMHVREIVRIPPNIIYDFLKIEDVHIYFQKHEQEEPFIFKTPSDAQEIEDLIHDLAIAYKKHKPLYD